MNYKKEDLRVMTWRLGLTPFYPINKSQRIKSICQLIKKINPDIICFQGVYTFLSFLKLKKELKYSYSFHSSMPEKGALKLINSGLVIFSKYPIRSEFFKPFNSLVGRDRFITKGIQQCTIQKLFIINTNLQEGFDFKSKLTRKKNINQLFKSIKHYNNINLVFAGSFGMACKSQEFSYLKDHLGVKEIQLKSDNQSYILIVEGSCLKQITYEEISKYDSSITSPFPPALSTINYPIVLTEDLHQLKSD
jgi:exonuclease III